MVTEVSRVPDDLYAVSAAFEDLLGTRVATQTRITHLKKNRQCTNCGRDFAPRSLEPCPSCGSKESLKKGSKRYCQGECKDKGIDTSWVPQSDCCPHCGSQESIEHPKNTDSLEVILGTMRVAEDAARKELEKLVKELPVWEWAEDVKGIGASTIGRIIGRTDFSRVPSVTSFWSHCGYGIKNGERQRKVKGERVSYDVKLRSACYLMGQNLIFAKGAYYRFYLKVKAKAREERPDWTPKHCDNHARRLMVKLALSHIYEIVRKGEGYTGDTRPYAFAVLGHDSGHYIEPWEMVESKREAVSA